MVSGTNTGKVENDEAGCSEQENEKPAGMGVQSGQGNQLIQNSGPEAHKGSRGSLLRPQVGPFLCFSLTESCQVHPGALVRLSPAQERTNQIISKCAIEPPQHFAKSLENRQRHPPPIPLTQMCASLLHHLSWSPSPLSSIKIGARGHLFRVTASSSR